MLQNVHIKTQNDLLTLFFFSFNECNTNLRVNLTVGIL